MPTSWRPWSEAVSAPHLEQVFVNRYIICKLEICHYRHYIAIIITTCTIRLFVRSSTILTLKKVYAILI